MHEPYTSVASVANKTNTSNDIAQKDTSDQWGTMDDFGDTLLHRN